MNHPADVVHGEFNYRCRCGAVIPFWQWRQYPRGCCRRARPKRWRLQPRPQDGVYGR